MWEKGGQIIGVLGIVFVLAVALFVAPKAMKEAPTTPQPKVEAVRLPPPVQAEQPTFLVQWDTELKAFVVLDRQGLCKVAHADPACQTLEKEKGAWLIMRPETYLPHGY